MERTAPVSPGERSDDSSPPLWGAHRRGQSSLVPRPLPLSGRIVEVKGQEWLTRSQTIVIGDGCILSWIYCSQALKIHPVQPQKMAASPYL